VIENVSLSLELSRHLLPRDGACHFILRET